MKNVFLIYDDCAEPAAEIREITGGKSFGDTIFKRKTLRERVREEVAGCNPSVQVCVLTRESGSERLFDALKRLPPDTAVLRLYSSFGIHDRKAFAVLLEKAAYIQEDYVVLCGERAAMLWYASPKRYLEEERENLHEKPFLRTEAFVDLSNVGNFRSFMSGGFDARYFNALEGGEYVVTKRSSNKQKIKSEYNFYHLLPDDMKMWFVMPFDFREYEGGASYSMERYHMTDIAIRYVHGAVGEEEFRDILNRLFYFLRNRKAKEVSGARYRETAENLYVGKVLKRMEQLKEFPDCQAFDSLIRMGTGYAGIDGVVEEYKKLYRDLTNPEGREPEAGRLVIGHGDLCFSNILYQKDASVLKLIDPKGAETEEELYTHPYYDLAKLSHSVCGCYDFFNSGLFQVSIEAGMRLKLTLDYPNGRYRSVFREYLEREGYDYRLTRLYEASLFLSMLPLHMDQEHKVFAFLLNAINIMEELRENV